MAPVGGWLFAPRLAEHNTARMTHTMNDAAIPCPSAASLKPHRHRTGAREDRLDAEACQCCGAVLQVIIFVFFQRPLDSLAP